MLDTTEKFCKDKAVNNAVLNGIKILRWKRQEKNTRGVIPSILSDALAVSFDNHIGHDYIDDADDRFDWYRTELRLPFDLQYFNKITKGGVYQKTLNVCLAGTGVGKSLFMCHLRHL